MKQKKPKLKIRENCLNKTQPLPLSLSLYLYLSNGKIKRERYSPSLYEKCVAAIKGSITYAPPVLTLGDPPKK